MVDTAVKEQDGSGGQGGDGALLLTRPISPSVAQCFLQTLSPDVGAGVPEHPRVGISATQSSSITREDSSVSS